MKKPKLIFTVIKQNTGYSAYTSAKDYSINTQGETFDELKINILDSVNITFKEENVTYTLEDISMTYDLARFFDFYKIINASALSKRLNMPQSLLSQYINGIKKPSPRQTQRILKGVQQIGRELAEINIF